MRTLFWLVVAALLPAAALAQEFTVEINPSQQSINQFSLAEYNITILHNYPSVEFFEVFSPEVLWDIRTKDPLHIKPNAPFHTIMTIQPLNINPGLYGVPVQIKRTGSNQVKKALLYMEVTGTPSSMVYLPAVRGTAEVQSGIDPREEIPVTVYLENQNRRNLTDLDIKMRSNVINQDFKATLDPLARKTFTFMARVDPATPPQEDSLQVTVIATEKDKGYQFDLPPVAYTVRSYGKLVPTIEVTKDFLKTTRHITLTNNANIVLSEPYAFAMPWYQRWVTSTSPKSRSEDGALVWDVSLNVGNSTVLRVTTNYRPAAILLILAVIMLILYYIFRSPITVRKSATVISTREGGISELKILLEVKNRTGKPVHQTGVVDLVPRIAELLQHYDVGTLTPNKVVRHERKGTIIKYEVGDIMPYEERVISYKIKSSLSILGGVSLPVAVAKFTTNKGVERTTSSNAPRVKFLG